MQATIPDNIRGLLKLVGLQALWLIGGLVVWGAYKLVLWMPSLPSEAFYFGTYALGASVIVASACSIFRDLHTEHQSKAAIRSRNEAERLRRSAQDGARL